MVLTERGPEFVCSLASCIHRVNLNVVLSTKFTAPQPHSPRRPSHLTNRAMLILLKNDVINSRTKAFLIVSFPEQRSEHAYAT